MILMAGRFESPNRITACGTRPKSEPSLMVTICFVWNINEIKELLDLVKLLPIRDKECISVKLS